MNIFKPNHMKSITSQPGLTLIELMVVIVVISILAAITVVGYGAWRTESAESAVKSDLSSLASGMENYRNWNDGYPTLAASTVFDNSATTRDIFRTGDNTVVTYISGDKDSYCVEGTSVREPSVVFHVSVSGGSKTTEPGNC